MNLIRCLLLNFCSLVLVFSISCDHAAPTPPARPVTFELFLARETDEAGLVAVKHPDTGQKLYREAAPVLTNSDVVDASVSRDEMGKPAVAIRLNAAAAKRLRAATTAHVGKPIVITLDGKVQIVATVHGTLSSSIQIAGKYTEIQADRIARGIME